MKDKTKLAIVLACYNRCEQSVRCIKSLMKASDIARTVEASFYIWDDASTDGTSDALQDLGDTVRVYKGPGGFFWAKSMYYAMNEAIKYDNDLYMMVNDDVSFYPNSISIMIESYEKVGGNCAIVGSSEYEGEFTYGGRDRNYNGILPSGELKRCTYADWNCFMTDREVIDKVGIICGKYEHAWGDYDYSSRLNRMSIPQYIATDYVGVCEDDHSLPEYLDPDVKTTVRLKRLFSPKGEPLYSFLRFHWVDKRFKGILIAMYSYTVLLVRVFFLRSSSGKRDN